MSALAQTLGNLGTFRLAAIGGVAAGLIAFFIFLTGRLAGPGGMVVLYSDLDQSDSGKIVAKLESQQIPYQLKAGGTQIYVPNDEVLKLRVALAESGLPSGGTVGYEIFDDSDTLGTTNFVQKINRLRALEGELARTIKSISNIENARVHIVMPQRQLFSREMQEPTATVVLKLTNVSRFSQTQVRAIQNLVATSVPGLKTSRISVIDNKGNLLARGGEKSEDGMTSPSDADEMRRNYERRLTHTVENLLEKSVGLGNVRAEVNADMDFDRITISSEEYDPEGQVVRSTQTVEEDAKNIEGRGAEGAVTVAANLPNAAGGAGGGEGAGARSTSQSTRVEETVNFEISKTTKNHIRESGIVKRLSVAVLIDGTYTEDANGNQVYQPRTPEEIAEYEKLVRSAVGFDEKRGDIVEVVNLQFALVEEEFAEEVIEPLFGLHKQDYFRIVEILVLSVVAILVIMMVVRPLLMRALEALPPPSALIDTESRLAEQAGVSPAALAGPESAVAAAAGTMPAPSVEAVADDAEALIDLRQIEGRVKASSLKKVGEIIDKHPEETVSIIRNWMFQEK